MIERTKEFPDTLSRK